MLLIDEVDRADDEFEAFLLEFLSDFAVTIPELGTITARRRPVVVLTSNRTRELHDAVKRRCLYHWIDYPTREREAEIVRARLPGAPEAIVARVCAAVARLRAEELYKVPGRGGDDHLGAGAAGARPRRGPRRDARRRPQGARGHRARARARGAAWRLTRRAGCRTSGRRCARSGCGPGSASCSRPTARSPPSTPARASRRTSRCAPRSARRAPTTSASRSPSRPSSAPPTRPEAQDPLEALGTIARAALPRVAVPEGPPEVTRLDAVPAAWSEEEVLRTTDFAAYTDAERRAAMALLARVARRGPSRLSRRTRPGAVARPRPGPAGDDARVAAPRRRAARAPLARADAAPAPARADPRRVGLDGAVRADAAPVRPGLRRGPRAGRGVRVRHAPHAAHARPRRARPGPRVRARRRARDRLERRARGSAPRSRRSTASTAGGSGAARSSSCSRTAGTAATRTSSPPSSAGCAARRTGWCG